MSLMSQPRDKNYKKLCGKLFPGQRFFYALNTKTFRMPNEKMCVMDGNPIYKFKFYATMSCRGCDREGCDTQDCCDPLCCSSCYHGTEIYIEVLNSGVEVEAEFDIGIFKPDNSITCILKETKKLLKNERVHSYFSLKQNRESIPNDGVIEIVLTIKNTEDAGKDALNVQNQEPGVLAKLAEKFSDTCMNSDAATDPLVDVTLHVEGKKIFGHKVILSLASKYFDRMFASNMKEGNTNDVYLENIGFTTLKSLVEFLYSDSIDEDNITLELLVAADRFEVMKLIEICCQKLSKMINSENVTEIWETSYIHSMEELKHDCVIFMARMWKSLSKDENVREMAKKYWELPFTVASQMSERSDNGN